MKTDLLNLLRRQQPEARQGLRAVEKRPPQHPVFDDVAERRRLAAGGMQVAMIVMQEQRRIVVGDADFAIGSASAAILGHSPMPSNTSRDP